MYCTQDCTCSLCRELRGIKQKIINKPSRQQQQQQHDNNGRPSRNNNDNFILKRRSFDFNETDNNIVPPLSSSSATSQSPSSRFEGKNNGLIKSKSSNEIWKRYDPVRKSKGNIVKNGNNDQHKVVIYFGDSIDSNKNKKASKLPPIKLKADDTKHAQRLFEEIDFKRNDSVRMATHQPQVVVVNKNPSKPPPPIPESSNVIKQLKTFLEKKNGNNSDGMMVAAATTTGSVTKIDITESSQGTAVLVCDKSIETRNGSDTSLPAFVESVVNGVIKIRIENNFECASKLVREIAEREPDNNLIVDEHGDESFDWSFVQDWRTRPSGNARTEIPPYTPSNATTVTPNGIRSPLNSHNTIITTSSTISPTTNQIAAASSSVTLSSGRIQSPAIATPAPRVSKEVAYRPSTEQRALPSSSSTGMYPSRANLNHSHGIDEIDGPISSPNSNGRSTSYSVPHNGSTQSLQNSSASSMMIPERDTGPMTMTASSTATAVTGKPLPHRAIAGPAKLTIQSIPVKSQPPMLSSGLGNYQKNNSLSVNTSSPMGQKSSAPASVADHLSAAQISNSNQQKTSISMRTHHHGGTHEFRTGGGGGLHRVQECHSSSDENRSSGHASMSDTGHGSSSPTGNRSNGNLGPLPEDRLAAGVTNRSARSRAGTGHSRSRQRGVPTKVPWSGGGLEDIKLAIQQLTMRSQTSTSTYSSLSAGSESSEPARRLGRYSSLETVNTNVTSADEFVWVDSHNRLVELQHPPWSQHCVLRVVRSGRCREHSERISAEAVPRLGYLLQRALVRIAREVQRLAGGLGLCSKYEVAGAFKIVLCPALADSCIKACLRAAAMFAVPGDSALRQSKSSRAGLQLPIGRFHRWMADARLGRFVHEYAAVYLSAGLENLLEEILLQCLPTDITQPLTATGLEHAIASSGDLWGLLQPYAHLNAGRIASGALTMPRWASQSSIGSSTGSQSLATSSSAPPMEPCLLTTCVGSITELRELVLRAQNKFQHTALSHAALIALFYFMRCSQLEHSDAGSTVSGGGNSSVQELCYERAYVVLPPLVEWLRVASAHAEYRHSILIDKDDVMQSARLLLPGVDCPPRPIATEEEIPAKKSTPPSPGSGMMLMNSGPTSIQQSQSSIFSGVGANSIDDSNEYGRRATLALAFRLMLSGRSELLIQASTLLPSSTRYDTLNQNGLTALMVAAIRNDETAIQMLLDAGADPNVEVPSVNVPGCHAMHPETQQWTALTFSACRGNYQTVRLLLERGAHVEGGARLSEDKCTLTPLQLSSGSGSLEVVSLLLAHGAHAFLSTQQKDSLCFSGTAQRGCYSAISVAAAHGHRISLRKLLSHPLAPGSREVLSLEEMLAEGDSSSRSATERQSEVPPTLSKTQIKCLQEAMYHSAENNHLDITVELRALGVPWTLHCWMHALAAAHELRLDAVIDQLLQDFLQVCPDDYSSQFVSECLPLLFNIFRFSKKEGTTLLLADIFTTCYGWESIKPIKEPVLQAENGSRIDPKFVNNAELSDVMFRVEGKIFYGHKIVLVTASPRFQSMLCSKLSEGNTPTVQINDIRYHIFQLVMQFLYSGGCNTLEVASGDVLELMAAASFFQLDGLLRYTESRCSHMIDIDNVVAMYIHAKVYNAPKLMEYCQGFLLQNMVALLTYDDSVKRLLFAKKIPNHDVLSGLLGTLQQRIKARRAAQNPSNIKRPATVASNKICK